MMSIVLMTILIVAIAIVIVIYPKKDKYIENFKIKGNYKSFELEICTKQKNDPPSQK